MYCGSFFQDLSSYALIWKILMARNIMQYTTTSGLTTSPKITNYTYAVTAATPGIRWRQYETITTETCSVRTTVTTTDEATTTAPAITGEDGGILIAMTPTWTDNTTPRVDTLTSLTVTAFTGTASICIRPWSRLRCLFDPQTTSRRRTMCNVHWLRPMLKTFLRGA